MAIQFRSQRSLKSCQPVEALTSWIASSQISSSLRRSQSSSLPAYSMTMLAARRRSRSSSSSCGVPCLLSPSSPPAPPAAAAPTEPPEGRGAARSFFLSFAAPMAAQSHMSDCCREGCPSASAPAPYFWLSTDLTSAMRDMMCSSFLPWPWSWPVSRSLSSATSPRSRHFRPRSRVSRSMSGRPRLTWSCTVVMYFILGVPRVCRATTGRYSAREVMKSVWNRSAETSEISRPSFVRDSKMMHCETPPRMSSWGQKAVSSP
mmetsp:Transcript_70253/g.198294  ORF Transcript_70253/g.198294 Transcript_70253/m.198294 type:complete len:261 (+) Transcript_70253:1614-2396(+)